MESRPGTKTFDNEEEAIEFAKERVSEHWVVHCRASLSLSGNWWVVDWWCQ